MKEINEPKEATVGAPERAHVVATGGVLRSSGFARARRSKPFAFARRLLFHAGIDRAVVYGVLSVVRALVFGPVTVWLIAAHFTPELQGYYYTFASLLALQVFVDLGLGIVIIQFASHEWAQLRLDERGRIVGTAEALSRLVSLGQIALRWYAVAGGIVAVGLSLAGYFFFAQAPQSSGIYWVTPWLGLCLVTGLNLCLVPIWSLLEGCHQVSQVYRVRLIQGTLMSIATWLAIGLGAGLWTATIASGVGLVCGVIFLRHGYWQYCRQILTPTTGPSISWRYELWPMQWKIALSWLSGYLVFSLFTPLLFHYHGAVVAGQMGMTWTLVSVLSGVSVTWAMSKAPQFGVLIARKEYTVLDRLFLKLTIASFTTAVCGAIAIWVAVYFLNVFHYALAARFLPPLPTGIFLAATVLIQLSQPQSFYLRAHKREPFLWVSIAGGVLIALSNWVLGVRYAATGMAIGYLAVVALFSVPVGTVIWYRCRAAWHLDTALT